MKDYEQIGNCNDTYCKYFDESMELNCAYSTDNSKCIKREKADGAYAMLAEVRAVLENIVDGEYRLFHSDSMDQDTGLEEDIKNLYKKVSEHVR